MLISLGVLILLGFMILHTWETARARQAQQDYLDRVFLPRESEPAFEPPFLTGSRQNRIYTSGQTAVAFASGFQPGEPVFVRLYHRMRGLLAAEVRQADALGQIVLAHPLKSREDSTPTGWLWFQAESLSGIEQDFAFRLEPGVGQIEPPTRGVYPTLVIPGSTVMFWCSGQKVDASTSADFDIDGKLIPAQDLDLTLYPVSTDGLLLARLSLAADDPTGDWTVHLGTCRLQFPVRSALHTYKERP